MIGARRGRPRLPESPDPAVNLRRAQRRLQRARACEREAQAKLAILFVSDAGELPHFLPPDAIEQADLAPDTSEGRAVRYARSRQS